MVVEIWDLVRVERNARGVEERNIWDFDLVEFKEWMKRKFDLVMFSEAWIGRWDLFATEVYGDQYMWWVVPVVNDLMNLFEEPGVGTILKVPNVFDVLEFLAFRR